MEEKKFAKDLLSVLFGNVIVVFSSILTGLVIPKVLGVTNYGYSKIFTLYLTYAALLHFGFVDGILLIHGGENYEDIDKVKFRRNTKFFLCFQTIIATVIVIISFFFFQIEYRYIFFMLGIDTLATNGTTYYQFISQATMRFRELTVRKVLQATLKVLVVFVFVAFVKFGIVDSISFYIYIFSIVMIDVVLLLWYVITYRQITFGGNRELIRIDQDIITYFKFGIVLTFAYQVSNLIFSLDRQFVSVLYDTDTYGVYSFAYSLVTIVTTVVNTISTVLFPNLKRRTEDQIITAYPTSIGLVALVVFAAMLGYYPLCAFIKWFLPEYATSLMYFRVLFPGIAISSCITVIIFNYYKVLNRTKLFFYISALVLVLAGVLNWGANVIFKSPFAISVASIVVLLVWYFLSQLYFVKNYKVVWQRNTWYIIIMMAAFYVITFTVSNIIIGFVSYLVTYLLCSYICIVKSETVGDSLIAIWGRLKR